MTSLPLGKMFAYQRRLLGPGGFTLLELLISLAILAILATIALPVAQVEVQRTREVALARALREIRMGIDDYKRAYDNGRIARILGASGYPATLDVLVSGVEDARDPAKHKIYFMRAIPRDPLMSDASVSNADTWGKRSYASEPDAPAEGADVFDVYSLSTATGLNGIAYRKW
ncbi:type II secretion system protein [Collimonas sp.]|jgi:general secretion pathway protein G|uniref:type II secretion system protein n=1 Tax=Collimonas sp. TaxID=1963772 RepID=UPI002CB60B83|nr:type II secretion system protein [Collimonas sp.]HWX01189.1 type II secretion system protein [Collimonas sp.]